MTSGAKQKALIFLGLVTLIVAMIAAGLSQLELQPGLPLPQLDKNQLVIAPAKEEAPVTVQVSWFVEVLLAAVVTGTAVYALYRLAQGTGWRKLLSYLEPVLIVISIASLLLYLIALMVFGAATPAQEQLPVPTATPLPTSPLGPVPTPVFWLVAAGLLGISIALGIWMLRSPSRRPAAVELVGLEAERAWQALKTGLDLRDVIVQCYRQMSLALEQDKGIEREEWMTTREFERRLQDAGIPREPISQLTRLFEAVRYGNWQPNPADERTAIDCLYAIMSFSRDTRGPQAHE